MVNHNQFFVLKSIDQYNKLKIRSDWYRLKWQSCEALVELNLKYDYTILWLINTAETHSWGSWIKKSPTYIRATSPLFDIARKSSLGIFDEALIHKKSLLLTIIWSDLLIKGSWALWTPSYISSLGYGLSILPLAFSLSLSLTFSFGITLSLTLWLNPSLSLALSLSLSLALSFSAL